MNANTVFPDIIIHKRETGQNLLAIEVKMSWKNNGSEFDKEKAKTYKKELGYKNSVYLELDSVTKTKINWL